MKTRAIRMMLTCALLVVLAGCGGGTSSPSVTPLAKGEAATNAILSGQVATNSTSLNNALQSFNVAHAQTPSNSKATFGYAMLLLATRIQAIADNYKGSSTNASNVSNVLGRAVMWNTNSSSNFNTGNVALGMLAVPAVTRDITPSQLAQLVSDLDSTLSIAIPLVEQVANDPSFTFTYTDRKGTVVVDQADVKVFVTGLYITSGLLQLLQAYNYDWGTFPFGAHISTVFPGYTVLTPAQYMPPAPFATLQPDGLTRFQTMKTNFTTAVARANDALDALAARTDNVRHLIDTSTLDIPTLRSYIMQFQVALTQPQTVTIAGTPTGVTVNLNAWFTNPPVDLHNFEPIYIWDGNNFVTDAAHFPDRTFGGLVTGFSDRFYERSVGTNLSVQQLAE